jgi:Rad3-related DNA helicase
VVSQTIAWPLTIDEVLAAFPAGYQPRPQQKYAIEQINKAFSEEKRFVVLESPTGAGKSFICMTFARAIQAMGGQTHFLTIQKTLQDQYTRDFPAPEIEVLKGRANYACTHPDADGANAAEGVCRRVKKGILKECITGGSVREAVHLSLPASCHSCPYWHQLQKCHDAAITLFNFSSFLYQVRIGRFGKRALMIIDEGHNIEAQLMAFVALELTEWALSLIGVEITRDISTKEQFMQWLRETDVIQRIQTRLKEGGDDEDTIDLERSEQEALEELLIKIENFVRYLNMTDWIIETVKYNDRRGNPTKKIVARPLYVHNFSRDLLFRYAERVLIMSATILDVDVWATNLGIPRSEIAHVETPCDFPVENRLIYKDYAGNMGRKHFDKTRPRFVMKVREILDRHRGQRGIIHCHSFQLAEVLLSSISTKRFLFQAAFKDKTAMLAEHARREDSVIVAPAMHEGFDLKDDLSRFQVIAKVPWPSLGDRVVKERQMRDDRWYAWLTALKLVQSYGRSVRSARDWAVTYILDTGFEAFLHSYSAMLPRWFLEALRSGIPQEVHR